MIGLIQAFLLISHASGLPPQLNVQNTEVDTSRSRQLQSRSPIDEQCLIEFNHCDEDSEVLTGEWQSWVSRGREARHDLKRYKGAWDNLPSCGPGTLHPGTPQRRHTAGHVKDEDQAWLDDVLGPDEDDTGDDGNPQDPKATTTAQSTAMPANGTATATSSSVQPTFTYNSTKPEWCAKVENCYKDVRDRRRLLARLRAGVESMEADNEIVLQNIHVCTHWEDFDSGDTYRRSLDNIPSSGLKARDSMKHLKPDWREELAIVQPWITACEGAKSELQTVSTIVYEARRKAQHAESLYDAPPGTRPKDPLADPEPGQQDPLAPEDGEDDKQERDSLRREKRGHHPGPAETAYNAEWTRMQYCIKDVRKIKNDIKKMYNDIYALQDRALGEMHPHPVARKRDVDSPYNQTVLAARDVAESHWKGSEAVEQLRVRAENAAAVADFWKDLYTTTHADLTVKYAALSNRGWDFVKKVRGQKKLIAELKALQGSTPKVDAKTVAKTRAKTMAKTMTMGKTAKTMTETMAKTMTQTVTSVARETVTAFVTRESTAVDWTPATVSVEKSIQASSPTSAAVLLPVPMSFAEPQS